MKAPLWVHRVSRVAFLAFWGTIVAAWPSGASDLECGQGPHEIEIARDVRCEDVKEENREPKRVRERMPDGTWSAVDLGEVDVVPPPACEWASFETWSDWPSCDGATLLGTRSFDGCNWTTCDGDSLGACSTTLAACPGIWGTTSLGLLR